MSDVRDLDTEVTVLLRRAGQRFTTGRRSMLEALSKLDRPATIGELVTAVPGLAVSSAYRHLTVLEQAGVVHRIVVGTDEHARFELTEALTNHHHHHLICVECGAVDDFTVPARLEKTMDAALDEVATATGFQTDHHRLDLVGVCAECAAR